jgi:hypothetical protein
MAAGPEVELVVFAAVQERRVEAADTAQPVAAEEHRRRVHEVSEQHRREEVTLVRRRGGEVRRCVARPLADRWRAFEHSLDVRECMRVVHRPEVSLLDDPAVGIHRRHVGPDHPDLGVGAEHLDLRLDLPGEEGVIRIEQRDEFSSRMQEAKVPRRRDAAVGLVDVAHRPAIALDDGASVVGRSVVDDDDLHSHVLLPPCRVDGAEDVVAPVPRRNDDRHFGTCGSGGADHHLAAGHRLPEPSPATLVSHRYQTAHWLGGCSESGDAGCAAACGR